VVDQDEVSELADRHSTLLPGPAGAGTAVCGHLRDRGRRPSKGLSARCCSRATTTSIRWEQSVTVVEAVVR
jgi:hypothetical protein